jgi:hypothetical protein
MQTLLDIGDLTEEITVGKVKLTMRGLSAQDVFDFLVRFPALRLLFDKTSAKEKKTLTAETMMQQAPQAIYEAIAMSTGLPKNKLKDGAAKVKSLPVGDQTKLVSKFFDLTFPDGVGPFVETLRELTSRFENLKTASNGASAESSPRPSPGAFVVDMPRAKRGPTRLAH